MAGDQSCVGEGMLGDDVPYEGAEDGLYSVY